jgi:hypothetical protein
MANNSIFKICLKEDNDWADLQLKDKEFQIIGALTLKAFQEDTSLTHSEHNKSWSDERNDLLG